MTDLDNLPYEKTVGADGAERMFNLTCALLAVSEDKGLNKLEIYESVPGYIRRFEEAGKKPDATLDRLFERDKSTLRSGGIRVEEFTFAHDEDNNQNTRYRIKRDGFEWPESLELTAHQVGLLNLAAEAWAGGSLSGEANRAVSRLRSLGAVGQESDIIGIAPKILSYEPGFSDLTEAAENRQTVTFKYRVGGGDEITTRTLEPWGLARVADQWLVYGFDHLRNLPRTFMLRRIVSKVQFVSAAGKRVSFDEPDATVLAQKKQEFVDRTENQIAVVEIAKDSEAWFKYAMDEPANAGSNRTEVHYYDIYVLAEDLRGYSKSVKVIEPLELASIIEAGYRQVLADHE
jgi:proteasome accessory factor B